MYMYMYMYVHEVRVCLAHYAIHVVVCIETVICRS